MMTNLYQSDVKLLSDEELETLSEELYEAYHVSSVNDDGDDADWWEEDPDPWIKTGAEDRYYQMRTEIYRRWEINHPEEVERNRQFRGVFVKEVLASLGRSMSLAAEVNESFSEMFTGRTPKIGDTIIFKKPYRYMDWQSGTMVEKEAQSVETDNERTQGSPSE